jgi:predicted aspartyl protease
MQHSQALTLSTSVGLARVISCDVRVCTPIVDITKGPDKITNPIKGIWDTGATGTAITQEVVDELGIKPVSFTTVNTASDSVRSPVYLVNLVLPNGVAVQGLRVTLGKLADAKVLIGMDVITIGDLSITNNGGKTVMTFGVPSVKEVDYVKDLQDTQATTIDQNGVKLSRKERRKLEREQAKKGHR